MKIGFGMVEKKLELSLRIVGVDISIFATWQGIWLRVVALVEVSVGAPFSQHISAGYAMFGAFPRDEMGASDPAMSALVIAPIKRLEHGESTKLWA